MRKQYNYLIVLLLVLCMQGCLGIGSVKKETAIGLKTAKDVFISTSTAAKELCDAGVVSDKDCQSIEYIYTKGRGHLITAKKIWDNMVKMDDYSRSGEYDNLIDQVVQLTGVVESIVVKYKEGK